jgi:inward rectifier potassium channel
LTEEQSVSGKVVSDIGIGKAFSASAASPIAGIDKPTFDPGLTRQYSGNLRRVINKDGQFNVRREGHTWQDWHPYLFLISASWPAFFALVTSGFLVLNTVFTVLYWAAGLENLKNSEAPTAALRFLNAFFFSAHTLTTVGYGNMWPIGVGANAIAVGEALAGVLGFAIATGLLFGRFSRPSARFGFSEKMVIAPYMGGTSLQFRVVNRRSNTIVDLEARILLMLVENTNGQLQRTFLPLNLERPSVLFFPLTWTVVHPIDEKSPLFGKTKEDLERMQAEAMIMMKGFDDTFGQTVNARYSYRYDEIDWGAKFVSAFEVDESGELRIHVNRVGETEPVALPQIARPS